MCDEVAEGAFADEGAAAFAAADEFDDPDTATAFEFGEGERAFAAEEWGVGEVVGLLAVSGEPVEIEVGVDLSAGGAVDVLGVDLVDLDEEFRDILGEEIEGDLVGGRPLLFE